MGNPANTNCLIASEFAPSIPKSQFTCLTQLDLVCGLINRFSFPQNRARSQIASRVGVSASQVHELPIIEFLI